MQEPGAAANPTSTTTQSAPAGAASPATLSQPAPHSGTLSASVVLPIAMPIMILAGVYTLLIQRRPMPASRRRIRTATGVLLICTVGLMAFNLVNVSAAQHRTFLILWTVLIAMVALLLLLAALDMLNTLRLYVGHRSQLAEASAANLILELRKAQREAAKARESSANTNDHDERNRPHQP